MPEEHDSQPMPIAALKALGREHLQAGRVLEAMKTFSEGLNSAPGDPELYLALGDIYHQSGDDKLALLMFNQARRRCPTLPGIDERFASLDLPRRLAPSAIRLPVPEEKEAVSDLLQFMTRRDEPISDEEIQRAAALLSSILTSSQPAKAVAEHLEEIDALLPALIELNIRQAQADGQPELAAGLGELLLNIQLQMESRAQPTAPNARAARRARTRPLVQLVAPQPPDAAPRLAQAAEALADLGCQVRFATQAAPDLVDRPDVILAANPHLSAASMQNLAIYAAAGVPILLDLDQSFEEMPANHPEFAMNGLGNAEVARAYSAALILARGVTVPSVALAQALHQARCPVRVAPDGWSTKNALWTKPAPRRTTLNLGWAGGAGQIEDVASIQRLVMRILRSYLQTQLVIAGDAGVFRLFDSLPEARKIYLPAVGAEDTPYTYAQFDVLMAPLNNTPFNRAQSDRVLMEAGIRQIPWVASPIPAFTDWGAGGLIATSSEDWFEQLQRLVNNPDLRRDLAEQGHQKAQQRQLKHLGQVWLSALQDCQSGATSQPAARSAKATL